MWTDYNRFLRRLRKMSPAERKAFAAHAGVSDRNLWRIVKGECSPTVQYADKLIAALQSFTAGYGVSP